MLPKKIKHPIHAGISKLILLIVYFAHTMTLKFTLTFHWDYKCVGNCAIWQSPKESLTVPEISVI